MFLPVSDNCALALVTFVCACNIYDESLLVPAPSVPETGSSGGDAGVTGSGGSGAESGGSAGADDSSVGAGGTPEAGAGAGPTDAARDAGPEAEPPCSPLDAPKRIFGAPSEGTTAIYAALSDLDLGDDPQALGGTRHRSLGYDLDSACTPAGSSSCGAPAWPVLNEPDGAAGADNTAGALFEKFSDLVSAFQSTRYTERIREQGGTLFLGVEGYNAEPDDGLVSVWVARTLPQSGQAWTGIDEWVLAADDYYGDLSQPKFRDTNAFVTRGTLVARFAALVLRLPNPDAVPLDIQLRRAVLSCRITAQSGIQPFRLEGCILSGAWHYRAALSALASFPVPAFGVGGPAFCRDDTAYGTYKNLVCGSVDLTAVAGSSSSCDALSFAARFDTVPAFPNTQRLETLPERGQRCATGFDPAEDDCR